MFTPQACFDRFINCTKHFEKLRTQGLSDYCEDVVFFLTSKCLLKHIEETL